MKSSFSIIIIFLALSLAGIMFVPMLPVKLFPSQTLPEMSVDFSMPGNSPRVIESEVTSRLEGAVARVQGLKEIKSTSGNSSGQIVLAFDRDTDMDRARLEVSSAIRQLWSGMPSSSSYPTISFRKASDDEDGPFMTWSISAGMEPDAIARYADAVIKPVVADIDGVAEVNIHGAAPMEWHLEYDAEQLREYGVTTESIISAIRSHYGSESIGIVPDADRWIRVARRGPGTAGGFNPKDITVVTTAGNAVPLSRLVNVSHREENPTGYFRINGLNSVYLNITSAKDANQLDVGRNVGDAIHRLMPELPEGMEINLSYDSTERIRKELSTIYFRTALTVLVLLAFLVLITRNIRYTLLTVISLAVNLAVAVLIYKTLNAEIQLYSLAGITISLNLILDNIIVMCDHYTRRGDRRAFPAILAATLTTTGALLVVFLLDDKSRLNLEDFVVVVVVNLLVSLAVALFLVPALAERMKIYIRHTSRPGARRRQAHMIRLYRRFIHLTLRWRVAFVTLMFGGIVFSAWLFFHDVREGMYWGRPEREVSVHVRAELPAGSTLRQMNAVITRMEEFLEGYKGINQYQTNITSGRTGSIHIWFDEDVEKGPLPHRLKSEIITHALTIGGGSWTVSGIDDNGFDNSVVEHAGNNRIKMTGPDLDILMTQAEHLRDRLLANPRIDDVSIRSEFTFTKDFYSELRLRPNMDALYRAGMTLGDFYDALTPVFGRDIPAGSVMTDGHMENVELSAVQGHKYDVWAMLNMPVRTPQGTFKVNQLASLVRETAPQTVVKENQSYVLCLQYGYRGSSKNEEKVQKEILKEFRPGLPSGYNAEIAGYGNGSVPGFERYWLLALVAAVIFFLCAILFNSLRKPLAVILMIPISYVGIFATFLLFHLKFDEGGFASFILLGGITVNAAIYIINEYENIRHKHPGMPAIQAYLLAFRTKIVPILMTVLSTILGFIPFLIGSDKEGFWFPLAAGTIGGMIFSLLAVTVYLPLFLLRRSQRTR